MEILLSSAALFVGIILVAKGGDFFVDAASWIAKALGIPSFIVGATIVSIATTLPEMIVSVMAAAQGSNEMAVGNAVGSVTANTGLIMGIAFIFMKVVIDRKQYMLQALLLIACAAVICLGSQNEKLAVWAAVVLIIFFITFMTKNLLDGKKSAAANRGNSEVDKSRQTILKNALMFVGGAAGIVLGSRLMVNGGTSLATLLGVPERIIGVTIVAVGTSIPELVTTITAIRKKEHGLSVGNIIGANILDLSLILPVCSLVSGQELPVSAAAAAIDLPVCLFITTLAIVPLLWRQKAGKIQGLLILATYIIYLIVIL